MAEQGRRTVQQPVSPQPGQPERKPVYDNPEGKVIDEREKSEQFSEIMHKEAAVGDERTPQEKAQAERDAEVGRQLSKDPHKVEITGKDYRADGDHMVGKSEPDMSQAERIAQALREIRKVGLDMPNSPELANVLEGVAQTERALLALDDALLAQKG